MSRKVDGALYVSAAEVAREMGVSRQTLSRWPRDGKNPIGHCFRDGQIVFTKRRVEEIATHANKVEPIGDADSSPMRLF